MKEIVYPEQYAVPGWVLAAFAIPVALVLGFVSCNDVLILAAVVGAVVTLVLFGVVPLSVPVKLIFLLVLVAFLQRVIGYFKLGELRGFNVGNILLLVTFTYWFLSGLKRGSIYRPSPIDFWLIVATIIIPLLSICFTVAFRDLPGYALSSELRWYKQWVTPFLYFFLIFQCLDNKSDSRMLVLLTLSLVTLAIFHGVPEALRFSNWRESRSLGIIGQANSYAALLAVTSPFFFLILFRLRPRLIVRAVSVVILLCMTLSLLTTFSRGGYVGFAIGLIGALYISYRGSDRGVSAGPLIVVPVLCLVPFVISPQLVESVQSRFTADTYKRARRKSYTDFGVADSFSGGRLGIWKAGLAMAQDKPLFGVGFHAFELELPNYHPRRLSNYPHNQYVGALAEGGIVWLAALLILFWKALLLLYHNWRVTLEKQDPMGQLICGGALTSFIIMICMCLTNDFFSPGPTVTIFWVCMAGAMKYGMLARSDSVSVSAR